MRELDALRFKNPKDYATVFFTVFFTVLLVIYSGQLKDVVKIPGPI